MKQSKETRARKIREAVKVWRKNNQEKYRIFTERSKKKKNQRTKQTARKNRMEWTQEERVEVATSALSQGELAIKLGRTYFSIQSQRNYIKRMGLV